MTIDMCVNMNDDVATSIDLAMRVGEEFGSFRLLCRLVLPVFSFWRRREVSCCPGVTATASGSAKASAPPLCIAEAFFVSVCESAPHNVRMMSAG